MKTKRVLRKRLIFLFLGIATIPFLLATAPTLVKFQDSQRASIIMQERRVASDAANEIANFIRLQFAYIEPLSDFLLHASEGGQSLPGLVEKVLFSHSDFFEVSVVSAEGKELARDHRLQAVTPADLRDQSQSEKFLAVQKDRYYIGPIFWEHNKPFFVIGEGFFSSRNEFLGAAFAQLDAQKMQNVVSGLSVTEELGRASIFDNNGIIIADRDFSKTALRTDYSRFGVVAEALGAADRRVVAGIFKNELGEEVIGASEPIQISFGDSNAAVSLDTHWFVVAEIPSSIALASVRDSTLFSLGILLLVLLAAVIAALIIAGKIVRPVEQLRQVVQKFRDGNLEYKVPIATGDEIEELATSFYTTADELRVSIKTIIENEKTIEAEKHQLERIISGITDAVIVTDTSGKVIVFNKIAEALTGYAMADVLAKDVGAVISIWDGDKRVDVMGEYRSGSGPHTGVLLAKNGLSLIGKKEGEKAYVNVVIGEIEDGDQVNVGRIVTLHDLSRERLLEQTKIDFVSLAAHQLRTPLTAIKWIFGILSKKDGGGTSPEQEELAKSGELSTQRMIALVNDLLNISKIEEGKFNFTFEPVSIEHILKELIAEEENEIKEKGITFTFTPPAGELPPTVADKEKLYIAFQNILENALTYTPKGGSVKISLAYDGTHFTVRIEDSGIGIEKSQLGKLFTKFFRGEKAVKLQTDGSGLGLFITKNIIEKHKGTVAIASEEGKGTAVTVSLPKMERNPISGELGAELGGVASKVVLVSR